MKKEDFTPGQTVYLLPLRMMMWEYLRIEKQIRETKVVSVGRKYITVEYANIKFDITNDFREVTNYAIAYKLYLSKEDIKNDCKRRQMEERVATAFHFPNSITRKMTLEELQTVFDIVKKHTKF